MRRKRRINKAVKRRIDSIGQKVTLKRYVENEENNDSIFQEDQNKTYMEDIPLKAVVRHNPPEKTLTELGITQDAEIVIKVRQQTLIQAGLTDEFGNPVIRLDVDRFVIQGREYNILQIKPLVQMLNQHMTIFALVKG